MIPGELRLRLPDWVGDSVAGGPGAAATQEDRVRFVLGLATTSITHGTGGPFAAAVFERDSGRLVSVGLNLVVPANCSAAHAEVVALSLAQQAVGSFDLSSPGLAPMQLVASSEMCAMCLGAVAWSGVVEVASAATTEDVETIVGFDEGPRPVGAADELRRRGIEAHLGVLRDEGRAVLSAYAASGGPVYNPLRREAP